MFDQKKKKKEDQKKSKYAEAYDHFLPFVMDSYGALGDKAVKLIDILRKESEDASAHRPLKYFLRRMAIVLQRGNAEIFREALHQHHKRSHEHRRHDCEFFKLPRDSAGVNAQRPLI